MRKPFYVNGIEVTRDNMDSVAHWCQGHVIQDGDRSFIRVPVERATTRRQTEAYVGTWVTVSKQDGKRSFKVYNREWLIKNFFELTDEDSDLEPLEIPEYPPNPNKHDGMVDSITPVAHAVIAQFKAPQS